MTDDELLDRLVKAFTPEPIEPPLTSVFALRGAIGAPPQPRLAWRPRRLSAAAAVFALVLSGSTTAFALTGAPLPRPVRVVAHGVGLPVDSVAVADTRTAADRLQGALARHDPNQINQAARQLRGLLAHLEPGEKRHAEQQTVELLQEANQAGEQGDGQHQNPTGPNTSPPGPPAGPSGSTGISGDQPTIGSPGNGGQPSNDTPSSGESGDAHHSAAGSQTLGGVLAPAVPKSAPSSQSTVAPTGSGDINQPGVSGDTGPS